MRQPDEIKFLLDANLSYRVADALKIVRLRYEHVSKVPGMGDSKVGISRAPDETIAKWCGATGHVLITVDDDFKGRRARTRLLTTLGAEVIVLSFQPIGLEEQHRAITHFRPKWLTTLCEEDSGERVWEQKRTGPLKLL